MALKERLSNWNERFKQLIGSGGQGYEELSTLERPLVDHSDDEDSQRDNQAAYRPSDQPPASGGAPPPSRHRHQRDTSFTTTLPSQTEELHLLSALAKDASEILWEMAALGTSGPEIQEVRDRALLLQKQLRGMIGDFQGDGDEAVLAQALEGLDMLNRCLDDQAATATATAIPGGGGGGDVAPPAAPVAATNPAPPATLPQSTEAPAPPPQQQQQQAEVPLISFD